MKDLILRTWAGPMSLAALFLFVFGFVVTTAHSWENLGFEANRNCVAWKTRKTLGLFKTVEPVGKSCEAELQFTGDRDRALGIEVKVPIRSFDSGEPERDAEVIKILGGNEHPNVVLSAKGVSKAEFDRARRGETVDWPIQIQFGGRTTQLKGQITSVSEQTFNVKVTTNFTGIGLKPPSVLGGLVAKVSDYLELHAQIVKSKEMP